MPLDLVVHGRGRPAEPPRHRPAALVPVQPPLDGEPVGLRQPRVGPAAGPSRPARAPAPVRHVCHPNPVTLRDGPASPAPTSLVPQLTRTRADDPWTRSAEVWIRA
ncbi:hypothetical protein HMPREF1316_2686, partial [Olsenella profusa F0195]